MNDHLEIAVYGKGGIGKSTVSANISAALAEAGTDVLQIGCDPKHDSTRQLMHGSVIPTVLEVLRDKGKDSAELSDILRTGFRGIGCIEAGGPKPGVGCAGRGIISAFEFLDKHHLREKYSRVIYDVLGDVVCGGFAVPVRREYADAVFLVTSGEYMALYAANNILRGIRNFDGDSYRRVAGIIFNERRLEDEDGRVRRFAEAVGLPILVKVPRSEAFATAEEQNVTLMELEGAEREKSVFRTLAELIRKGPELYAAHPLGDEELEATVLGRQILRTENETVVAAAPKEETPICELPTEAAGEGSALRRPPLYGCAFNGAAQAAVRLTDAIVIAHGPKACAFYTLQTISSPGRKNLFNRGVLLPSALSPNFVSTDIGHGEAVFGGMELLRSAVEEAVARKPGAVIVISTCVSGIIGDDLKAVEALGTEEIPVITLAADGDIYGDYTEGISLALETLVHRLMDTDAPKRECSVNLIGETAIAANGEGNFRVIERLLGELGVEINCRFLGGATTEELRNLAAAPLNILCGDTADAHALKDFLVGEYGFVFLEKPLPVGFDATVEWLRALGAFFGKEAEAEALIEKERGEYEKEIARAARRLKGKKLIFSTINSNIDWLLSAVTDAGMELPYVGVVNYFHTPLLVTNYPEKYPMIRETYDITMSADTVRQYKPDILLSAYASRQEDGVLCDTLPMIPDVGTLSAVHLMDRWIRLLDTTRKGAWENDKELFEKYFA